MDVQVQIIIKENGSEQHKCIVYMSGAAARTGNLCKKNNKNTTEKECKKVDYKKSIKRT